MTPPKPVDLDKLKIAFYDAIKSGGYITIIPEMIRPIISEIEHLRARVKDLEDGK